MVKRDRERGSSLIIGILATAMIGAAVLVVHRDLNDRQHLFQHQAVVLGLIHLTDGAVAETLAELDRDAGFSGMEKRRVGDGVIWSRVASDSQGTVLVVAEAELDGWCGTIEAEVEMMSLGPRVLRWNRSTKPKAHE